MINIILILFLSISTFARVSFELIPAETSVKQGEIVAARLIVKETEGQAALPVLKGKNLGKTLYLLNMSPFMGKQGELQSEVKVIFLTVPQSNEVIEVINGNEVRVGWNNLEVIPTKGGKSFLLGEFEIPARKEIFKWVLILSLIVVLGLTLNLLLGKNRKKKLVSEKKKVYKNEILGCSKYEDVVTMWQQKLKYIEIFPELEPMFKKLEQVLFKYQFKLSRTESEIHEVMNAYKTFKSDVSGVLNGI